MGSSRCCRPGTSWKATGRPITDGVRRIARLQDIGHPGGPAIRRGEDRHPFSACQKRARQWECTHRNLQVTGEERIKESNRDGTLRVAQQKTRFAAQKLFSLPKLLIE